MRLVHVLCILCLASGAALADNKLTNAAKDAVDPNCTPSKAAKGAAMKATVGVGNRCGVAETARDATGVDGKVNDVKKKVSN